MYPKIFDCFRQYSLKYSKEYCREQSKKKRGASDCQVACAFLENWGGSLPPCQFIFLLHFLNGGVVRRCNRESTISALAGSAKVIETVIDTDDE